MKRGSELILEVERTAFEGKAVARHSGMVVFVRGGVPGDRLRARVTRVRKSFAEADPMELIDASPLRQTPRCRYAGVCGGCTWQHVKYGTQLEFKRDHVVDTFERIGGFRGIRVEPTLGSEDQYFYRNKMEFSFGTRWLPREEVEAGATALQRFGLGLHLPQRFDRILDIEECWLQSDVSARLVNTVREFCRRRELSIYSTATHTGFLRHLVIREGKRTGDRMVNLVTSEHRPPLMEEFTATLLDTVPDLTTICNNVTTRKSMVAIGESEVVLHGPGTITERLGDKLFRVSANSFFQTNTAQAERLYEEVRRLLRAAPDDIVFDCYSGTGTIALTLAGETSEVVGIESVPAAVQDAQRNAGLNQITNCRFLLGDLKEKLGDELTRCAHERNALVVLDPPRAGLHESVISILRRFPPRRIVYVSCNPATQARDLALLCADRAYDITWVQPLDMFPHTFHIECVVCLERNHTPPSAR